MRYYPHDHKKLVNDLNEDFDAFKRACPTKFSAEDWTKLRQDLGLRFGREFADGKFDYLDGDAVRRKVRGWIREESLPTDRPPIDEQHLLDGYVEMFASIFKSRQERNSLLPFADCDQPSYVLIRRQPPRELSCAGQDE